MGSFIYSLSLDSSCILVPHFDDNGDHDSFQVINLNGKICDPLPKLPKFNLFSTGVFFDDQIVVCGGIDDSRDNLMRGKYEIMSSDQCYSFKVKTLISLISKSYSMPTFSATSFGLFILETSYFYIF